MYVQPSLTLHTSHDFLLYNFRGKPSPTNMHRNRTLKTGTSVAVVEYKLRNRIPITSGQRNSAYYALTVVTI